MSCLRGGEKRERERERARDIDSKQGKQQGKAALGSGVVVRLEPQVK